MRRLPVLVLLVTAFLSFTGCAVKTGTKAGSISAESNRLVLSSLPGEAEGLVTTALMPEILRGWDLLRDGHIEKSRRLFNTAVGDPSSISSEELAAAKSGLGFVLLSMNSEREALLAFGVALAARDGYGPALMGQAMLHRLAGRSVESFRLYERVASDYPLSALLTRERAAVRVEAVSRLVQLGGTAEQEGDWSEATVHFLSATVIEPGDHRIHGRLAAALESNGRYGESIGALDRAVTLAEGPAADAYRTRLAWLELEHGRSDRAVSLFRALLSVSPADSALEEGLVKAEKKLRLDSLPGEYHLLFEGAPLDRGGLAAIITLEWGWDMAPSGVSGDRPNIILDDRAHWAAPYIREVVNRGVMDLYQNHTFRPDTPVTRGDLAVAACWLLDHETKIGGAEPAEEISDLSRDHRHYDCICRLVGLDLLNLFPGHAVRINADANGDEALLLISRIHRLQEDRQP